MSSGICLQESAAPPIINDNAAKLVIASELGAVSLQISGREGGTRGHVVTHSLCYATFGLRGSADMSHFPLGVVDHIDASAIRCIQFSPKNRKGLEWRAHKLDEKHSHRFLFARHLVLLS